MNPQKKKYTGYFLFILISSFIVIVLWIATNIYSKFVSSTIDEALTIQTKAINPSFDEKTINKLKSRQKATPLHTLDAIVEASPTASIDPPVPTQPENDLPLPTSLPSFTPEPSPLDTGGAI
jgi:hypothetical protein